LRLKFAQNLGQILNNPVLVKEKIRTKTELKNLLLK